MTSVVSLLRGVNVGGHHSIRMDALRALYESLGLRNPQTYVQSGNVVFRTEERNLDGIALRIEEGIEGSFGFRPRVMLRTAAEMRSVIAANPFATRPGIEPGKFLVMFLAGDPGEEVREKVRGIKVDPEELWIEGRELYVYFPDGMGRSKLSTALLEKTLKVAATGRNWNTVTKLLELASQ
jgi:uncharacterized protein (DUF1697 family)